MLRAIAQRLRNSGGWVMSDAQSETGDAHCLISLSAAGRLAMMIVDGRHASRASMSRYATRGRTSRRGRIVLLRTVRVGGKLATCRQWIAEFLDALNDDDQWATPRRATPDRADAQLAALGI